MDTEVASKSVVDDHVLKDTSDLSTVNGSSLNLPVATDEHQAEIGNV